MRMGPNMQSLLKSAKRSKDWVIVGDDVATTRAADSLKKAGLVKTRKTSEGLQIILKDFAGAGATSSRSARPTSKFQKAVAYVRKHPNIERPALVDYLQNKLDMTPAGSNTYATAAIKEAKATRH